MRRRELGAIMKKKKKKVTTFISVFQDFYLRFAVPD